jgi:WD40 repeat protein
MQEPTAAEAQRTVDYSTASYVPAGATPAPEPIFIEGYEILGKLDEGGMGVVYKARQLRFKRDVAIKMVRTREDANPAVLARFRTEAIAVARLNHPNIVQVFEAAECEGQPFYSMEYMNGGSLFKRLRHTPQPARQAAELVHILAKAVDYAHRQGIIHRDLKPGNVLLSCTDNSPDQVPADAAAATPTTATTAGRLDLSQWTVKIADFGLAKILGEDGGQTATGDILGTPEYMAPEQAPGLKNRTMGKPADVYALGALLYWALTGQPPFKGVTKLDTLDLLRTREPVPPSRILQVPPDLETICLKCLQKEPRRRYESAAALADDLGRFIGGEPILARPVSRRERAWRWCRRNPAVATLAFVLVNVLLVSSIGGVGLAAWALQGERLAQSNLVRAEAGEKLARINADEAQDKERLSRRKSYALSVNKAHEDWKNGRLTEVLRRLEEQKTLAGAEPDQLGFEWHYLNALCRSELQTFPTQQGRIWCVAESPDGRWFASAGDDGSVQLRQTSTGDVARSWKGHQGRVRSVAFTPDGQQLASAGFDRRGCIWSLSKDLPLQSIDAHDSEILCVAYSRDGKWLATASKDYTIKLWRADTGTEVRTLNGHKNFVHRAIFGPDGSWLASASEDGTVRVWDVATGRERRKLGENLGRLLSLAVSADGAYVAAGNADGRLLIWNFPKGEVVHDRTDDADEIRSLAFSPDGARLVMGRSDMTARVWDWRAHAQVLVLGHMNQVLSVTYAAAGRTVVTAAQGQIKVWDAANSQEYWSCMAHLGEVHAVAYSPAGDRLASGSSDRNVIIWDAKRGDLLRTLTEHKGPVFGVAWAPNGASLASASDDKTVRIWNSASGTTEHTLNDHAGPVRSVAYSPDGKLLASGSDDGTVRLWNAATGASVETLPSRTGPVYALTFSPDGRLLAWTGESSTVRVWDVARRQEAQSLVGRKAPGETNAVGTAIAFSPDSKRLARAGNGAVVELWDVATGKELNCLLGHNGWIRGIAFSPDGTRLASAGWDRTVIIWDAVTGEEILRLGNHNQVGFHAVSFHPNGRQLACARTDWSLDVWDGTADARDQRTRREAWSLVRFHCAKAVAPEELAACIDHDPTVSEDVKKAANSVAETYWRSLADREASQVVASLFGQGLFREEVVDHIRTSPTITSRICVRAVALAASASEIPFALSEASWSVVRKPGASAAELSRAVRQAEAAFRLAPALGAIPTTLGVAYYRIGKYKEAIDVLNAAEELYAKSGAASYPPNLAVLSICHLKLGNSKEARTIRECLSRVARLPKWLNWPEAHQFIREAEAAFRQYDRQPVR